MTLAEQIALPPASFHHLKRDQQLLSSLYHCIAEDEYGFVWFGSYHGGGLYRFDGYDLRTFVVDPSDLSSSLTSNRINTVSCPGDGQVWIGTQGGFNSLDLVTGAIHGYANDIGTLPGSSAYYTEPIVRANDGRYWVGSAYGLAVLDSVAGDPTWITADNAQGPLPGGVVDLAFDRIQTDLLWLGTSNGLYSFDTRRSLFRYYPSGLPEANVLSVMDIYQDSTGVLWLGATGSHLVSYHPDVDQWRQFLVQSAHADTLVDHQVVFNILPAGNGYLWLTTQRGVGIFDSRESRFESWVYDPSNPDGLLPNDYYRAMMTDRHGRLWVAGWYGIQYAKSAFPNHSQTGAAPSVVITDIRTPRDLANQPKPLLYFDTISLGREQRDLTIQYVLPNPLDVDDITYEYRLIHFDKDWVTTRQRTVRYPRLPGGHYTFEIRARQGATPFGTGTRLAIHVEKKLTEQLWFWLIALVMMVTLVFVTVRQIILRVRHKERVQREFDLKIAEIQMQALRAQMNPHFLFNSLNAIKYYAISKDKDATADYVSKFSLLVRTILNNSKSHTISVKDELAALQLYIEIEHLRLEGKFDYHIDIDQSVNIETAQIPPMVLQPYVENAIWHGLMPKDTQGQLMVQVKDVGNSIQCIIEDNGIGREQSQAHKASDPTWKQSMGMQITGDRIALINRIYGVNTQAQIVDLHTVTGKPCGTRVIITIPVIRDEQM